MSYLLVHFSFFNVLAKLNNIKVVNRVCMLQSHAKSANLKIHSNTKTPYQQQLVLRHGLSCFPALYICDMSFVPDFCNLQQELDQAGSRHLRVTARTAPGFLALVLVSCKSSAAREASIVRAFESRNSFFYLSHTCEKKLQEKQ